jgi:hypothetical protein
MSLVLLSSGGGSVTLNEPATASNFTQTLPAATGEVMVSGNMPAFSAYLSASQTPSSATNTKIAFNAEEFDTANAFDSTTNYRFTPQVAGYYQINALMSNNGTAVTGANTIFLYKNGVLFKRGNRQDVVGVVAIGISSIIYLNGSTDYLEIYGFVTGTTPTFFGDSSASYTYFNGSLVRSA